jgi:hypothetical protein
MKWIGKIAAMFRRVDRVRVTRTVELIDNGKTIYYGSYDDAPANVKKYFDDPRWQKWWEEWDKP